MNSGIKESYQRLQEYSLDAENAGLSQRLVKDNGWTAGYCERVMSEYKKFVLLAMVADHVVVPSDQVDQVWHLHLTYTRSYWDEFCKKVLNASLHHEPSHGGRAEQLKYKRLYQKTLESYQRLFNETPPAEIWPSTQNRFGCELNFVRINKQQHWLIRKPVWLWSSFPVTQKALPMLLILLLNSGCTAVLSFWQVSIAKPGLLESIIALDIGEFALLYLGIALLLIAVSRRLYQHEKRQQPDTVDNDIQLDAEQLAYLVAGPERVIMVAITALLEKGCVKPDDQGKRLEVVEPCQPTDLVERAIINALGLASKNLQDFRLVYLCSKNSTESIRKDLIAKNLWLDNKCLLKGNLLLALPLLALGLTRTAHDIQGLLNAAHYFFPLLGLAIFMGFVHRELHPTEYAERIMDGYLDGSKLAGEQNSISYAVAIDGSSALENTAWAVVSGNFFPKQDDARNGGGSGGGCGGCGGGC